MEQEQQEVVEQTNLPSEEEEQSQSFSFSEDDITDGKYLGKWNSPQEMADHIKNMEDKYANTQREISDKDKQTTQEIEELAEESKLSDAKQQVNYDVVPELIENGMVITDEIRAKMETAGLSDTDVKLKVYEVKETIAKNISYVGDKETYDNIMAYHAETMTDQEKIEFNYSAQDSKNNKALVLGLKVMYDNAQAGNGNETYDRVRGNTPAVNNGIKPYASKQDLLRDKAYADSRAASASDKAKFRQRLGITPEEVWLS